MNLYQNEDLIESMELPEGVLASNMGVPISIICNKVTLN